MRIVYAILDEHDIYLAIVMTMWCYKCYFLKEQAKALKKTLKNWLDKRSPNISYSLNKQIIYAL